MKEKSFVATSFYIDLTGNTDCTKLTVQILLEF